MRKKIGLIGMVLLALLLNACEMNASTPPPDVQASPTLVGMGVVEVALSQTAAVLAGESTPAVIVPEGTGTVTPPVTLPQDTPDPALPSPTTDPSILPTDAAPPPQQPVQTDKPESYTLRQGEFIYCIARRFDVDPDETLKMNGLWDSETIYPGLTIKIPVNTSFPGVRARTPHPATYTVQSGDTIFSIACLYGDVRPGQIANANGLPEPFTLTPGSQLQIP